jgi:hypothetical integral membrane protein (TIGR02206 family)
MGRSHFVMFGPAHLTALALTFILPLLLAGLVRLGGSAIDRAARLGLAAMLGTGWVCWLLLFAQRGWLTLGNGLPLNLCDWACAALVVALLTRNQFAYELGYFWGLGGTLQGVVTPDMAYDFPDAQFVFFFIEHGGIIAALLYLTLGTGLRTRLRALPWVLAATLGYAAVAGLADWALAVNYGFLRAKPANVSLLSVLSPWPWYIPELVLVGSLSLLVYYAPFALLDACRDPAQKTKK